MFHWRKFRPRNHRQENLINRGLAVRRRHHNRSWFPEATSASALSIQEIEDFNIGKMFSRVSAFTLYHIIFKYPFIYPSISLFSYCYLSNSFFPSILISLCNIESEFQCNAKHLLPSLSVQINYNFNCWLEFNY